VLLRRWRGDDDIAALAAINADPRVMENFVSTQTRAETASMVERFEDDFARLGYGAWAVELPGQAPLIGFIGLVPVGPPLPFAPAVEVGWRLDAAHWGQGLAHEGAVLALAFAFDELGLDEVVATTAAVNTRSWRLMDRLGMRRDHDGDFVHPLVPVGHRLGPHVLYRLRAGDFAARASRS
jgi:RimJ/RimL family protein N-acetyltransferase